MSKEILLDKTIQKLRKLPISQLEEVDNYADFLLNKVEEMILSEGVTKLSMESGSLKFLEDEEDLHTVEDLKEKF
jgi:hypothetical protein